MRRDPTEFRQRFAAWKDGENYWDTRVEDVLPGYSGGKTGFYSTHRDKWKLFLISKGVGAEQADRLSVYFAALDSLESGGGTSSAARQKNNFGGMLRGGKNISYDTVQDYMNDKWNMMNKRFSRALNAKTVQEYATLINDPKYAGKGYLYAVADGYNQKNPLDRTWVARQIQHMNNYTKAMMGIAGLKGFVARPVPKAPVVSKAEPILKANPIPSAVELLKQNELPVVLPEPTVTTTQTPTQAAQQAQLSEYIQKPLVSEKVPVLGGDYWENFFNNNSLDQFQSLIQQLMTSHKHGKNILPRHADGKTPGEYNEELVELPEVRVDNEGNVVQDGRRGSIRLPNLEVIANPIDVGRGEAARIFKNELPYPLRTSTDYDDLRAYELGYNRSKNNHLPSRDWTNGRILKKPTHPTYLKALTEDALLGYYPLPQIDSYTYTQTWKGNEQWNPNLKEDIDVPLKHYKHGKNPIHINPANRGKFNALKKRTGKTTELLTHSKNPLTRKRAVFALNSRKWRRK